MKNCPFSDEQLLKEAKAVWLETNMSPMAIHKDGNKWFSVAMKYQTLLGVTKLTMKTVLNMIDHHGLTEGNTYQLNTSEKLMMDNVNMIEKTLMETNNV